MCSFLVHIDPGVQLLHHKVWVCVASVILPVFQYSNCMLPWATDKWSSCSTPLSTLVLTAPFTAASPDGFSASSSAKSMLLGTAEGICHISAGRTPISFVPRALVFCLHPFCSGKTLSWGFWWEVSPVATGMAWGTGGLVSNVTEEGGGEKAKSFVQLRVVSGHLKNKGTIYTCQRELSRAPARWSVSSLTVWPAFGEEEILRIPHTQVPLVGCSDQILQNRVLRLKVMDSWQTLHSPVS